MGIIQPVSWIRTSAGGTGETILREMACRTPRSTERPPRHWREFAPWSFGVSVGHVGVNQNSWKAVRLEIGPGLGPLPGALFILPEKEWTRPSLKLSKDPASGGLVLRIPDHLNASRRVWLANALIAEFVVKEAAVCEEPVRRSVPALPHRRSSRRDPLDRSAGLYA